MRRNYIEYITLFLTIFILGSDFFYHTGLSPLFIPAAIFAFYLNIQVNRLTRNHNVTWRHKMQNYLERIASGSKKSIQDKIYGDLTFTILESWTIYSIFLGIALNVYLLPTKVLNPIEGLCVYLLLFYGMLMDFLNGKHPRNISLGVVFILLSVHISLKILGINIPIILIEQLFA